MHENELSLTTDVENHPGKAYSIYLEYNNS